MSIDIHSNFILLCFQDPTHSMPSWVMRVMARGSSLDVCWAAEGALIGPLPPPSPPTPHHFHSARATYTTRPGETWGDYYMCVCFGAVNAITAIHLAPYKPGCVKVESNTCRVLACLWSTLTCWRRFHFHSRHKSNISNWFYTCVISGIGFNGLEWQWFCGSP